MAPPLATLTWLQEIAILHPEMLFLGCLIFCLLIAAIIFSCTQQLGIACPLLSSLVFISACAFCWFGIGGLAKSNYSDIYQTEHIQISKIIHVKGTQSYLAYDATGKKYKVNNDDTEIDTDNKPSAKITITKPRPGINKEIIDHYDPYDLYSDSKLNINLTPQMKHTKTEEWSFN